MSCRNSGNLYNSLITLYLNYSILVWGIVAIRLENLQKESYTFNNK